MLSEHDYISLISSDDLLKYSLNWLKCPVQYLSSVIIMMGILIGMISEDVDGCTEVLLGS